MGEISNNTFGTLSSAPDNTIITTIYNYLSCILTTFKANKDENENVITSRLCKSLTAYKPPEYSFYFQHQNFENEKSNATSDFTAFQINPYVYTNDSEGEQFPSLVTFEAKRLSSKLPRHREKEYVLGEYSEGKCTKNSGGIERFKNGKHGSKVSNAGMVGYLQTDSPAHWLEKINGWINEQVVNPSDANLIWNANDILSQEDSEGTVSRYCSLSSRILGDDIRFTHFWLSIST